MLSPSLWAAAHAHIQRTRAATHTTPAHSAHTPMRGTLWLASFPSAAPFIAHPIGSICTTLSAQLHGHIADSSQSKLSERVAIALADCGWCIEPICPTHTLAHPHHFPLHPDANARAPGWLLRPIATGSQPHLPRAQTPDTSLSRFEAGYGHPTTTSPATVALNALAHALHQHGACMRWRDEQIAIHPFCPSTQDFAPQPIATVERAAVRVLGIATQAVHLVGYVGDLPANGAQVSLSELNHLQIWLQQRSPTKATHPSKWDTLMGGMCAADDAGTVATAGAVTDPRLTPYLGSLARETGEEAGLALSQLIHLRHGGHIDITCPAGINEPSRSTQQGHCPSAHDAGWVRERIHWACAALASHTQPRNRDGEVAQFALLRAPEVLTLITQGQCTPEAELVLGAFLGFDIF